jgi:two-component system response regulator FlrC
MARVTAAQGLEKKHGLLVGQAAAVMSSWPEAGFPGGEVLLADATHALPARRRDDRLLVLEQADGPARIQRMGAGAYRFAYSDGACPAARAALVAMATVPGNPVHADTGAIALLNLAARVAAAQIPVLIEGPTGTGKEVLARYIHQASARKDGPFVAVNCAAMPETMLEALLFGHKKGAFTGATEASEGLFRAADGGTLLLDELGEMPLPLQAKLLRALQEGEILPLGATQPVKVDVRIVACTNRDLPTEIAEGRFREDLYYRLNVFPLRIAALRERPDDVGPLACAMLLRHATGEQVPLLDASALAMLAAHAWPGNVRELENVVRRALLLAGDEPVITADHIVFDHAVRPVAAAVAPAAPAALSVIEGGRSLSAIVRRSESQIIMDALEGNRGNRIATARALGISERTLRYRLASMRETGVLAAGGAR